VEGFFYGATGLWSNLYLYGLKKWQPPYKSSTAEFAWSRRWKGTGRMVERPSPASTHGTTTTTPGSVVPGAVNGARVDG